MKLKFWPRLGIFGFGIFALEASDSHYYRQGQALSAQRPTTLPSPETLPGFQGRQIPEAHLTPQNIQPALNKTLNAKNHVSQFVAQSHDQRLRFDLDPTQDPLFTTSDTLTHDPLATLKAETTEISLPDREHKTRHRCQQSGESYLLTCTRNLHVQTVQKTKTYSHTHIRGKQFRRSGRKYGRIVSQTRGPHSVRHDQWYDYTQKTYLPDENSDYFDGWTHYPHIVQNHYIYTKRFGQHSPMVITQQEYDSRVLSAADIEESWTHDCEAIEQKVDQGVCTLTQELCSQPNTTRVINDHTVSRPCWQKTLTYHCAYPVQNSCDALKSKGCVQLHSQCHHKIGSVCVLYDQTYECIERQPGETRTRFSGDTPWCLDGHCTEQGYAPNSDMAEALSKLMIFKEMQKKGTDLSLFKGDALGCDRLCLSFKDCCHKKGWGLGLSGCTEQDKVLGRRRENKECVYVGTYCAEKVLGQCVRKRSSYCCFDSKLARLVQEQGRGQLGLNFGNAQRPQCQGFTVDQITKLNFEQIDLSSLFIDLLKKVPPPNLGKLTQDINADWKNKMPRPEHQAGSYLDTLKQQRNAQDPHHALVF